MTTLEKVQKLIPKMTPPEKMQLLQWLTHGMKDSFPGIEHTPEVVGGEPCIVRTRIPVWTIIQAQKLGSSEADILQAYPTLRIDDLINARVYYQGHLEEIEQQILENELD